MVFVCRTSPGLDADEVVEDPGVYYCCYESLDYYLGMEDYLVREVGSDTAGITQLILFSSLTVEVADDGLLIGRFVYYIELIAIYYPLPLTPIVYVTCIDKAPPLP